MESLWTVADVARFLTVKRSTIYSRVKQRSIPQVALSKGDCKTCVRFRLEAMRRWLRIRDRKTQQQT